MDFSGYQIELENIRRRANGGGDPSFYVALEDEVVLLSKNWSSQHGVLSDAEVASLIESKYSLIALIRKG